MLFRSQLVENKNVYANNRKRIFMKPVLRFMLFLFVPFALASCADKEESAQSCAVQLDEQKYSTVAENENCTNYERATLFLLTEILAIDVFLNNDLISETNNRFVNFSGSRPKRSFNSDLIFSIDFILSTRERRL